MASSLFSFKILGNANDITKKHPAYFLITEQ